MATWGREKHKFTQSLQVFGQHASQYIDASYLVGPTHWGKCSGQQPGGSIAASDWLIAAAQRLPHPPPGSGRLLGELQPPTWICA